MTRPRRRVCPHGCIPWYLKQGDDKVECFVESRVVQCCHSRQEYPMLLAGGVLGVDVIDGAIAPRLTYAVLRAGQ